MNIIIKGHGEGKTTELIKQSAKNNVYIMTLSLKRSQMIANMARDMGLIIPYPVTYDDYIRTHGFAGSFIDKVYIDDADDLLQRILSRVNVEIITMTQEQRKDAE